MKPGTEGGENFEHVLHEIVLHHAWVCHNQPASLGRQGSLHVLALAAHQPVPMLYHDRLHRWVR